MNQFTASLWGDEAFSAILSFKSIPEIISVLKNDTAPPLYNIVEHFVFKTFGSSEIAIRGLSFFFYLVAVYFVFLIGKEIENKKTGLLAAILTFLNPFFFIYAFEGRMYSIMAAGVVASMYFFIKKQWFGFVLAATWALYSHHFAIFAIFVEGLLSFLFLIKGKKQDFKNAFLAFLAIGILYSPWLLPLYRQTKMVAGGFWLSKPNLTDLRNLIYEYLARGTKNQLTQLSLYLVFLVLGIRKWTRDFKTNLTLILWFLLPILLTWFLSQKFQSIFYNRYMLYTIPAAMLLLASKRRKTISLILISIVVISFLIVDTKYFFNPQKDPFRDLAEYVKNNQKENDYLINFDAGNHKLWESKYYGIPAPIYTPEGNDLPFFVGTALMEPGDLVQEIPVNTERIGVITKQEVDQISFTNFTREGTSTFGDLKFVWFSKR